MIKKILHLEYGIAFILTLVFYFHLDFSIWLFLVLLFLPDVTMIGYLVNPFYGSIIYNIGHNLLFPLVLVGLAIFLNSEPLVMFALIWLAHIFLDRFLGYGLKYKEAFKATHMQKIN